jgi:GNAT superfamily N-acetyltransferase
MLISQQFRVVLFGLSSECRRMFNWPRTFDPCKGKCKQQACGAAPMRLIRYQPEYREPMLALHRSAIAGLTLGMGQQEDEADLMAIEQVYLRSGGEFLIGLLDDRLMAMGGVQRLSDTAAELRRMRIDRELQGKGYGTRLLGELERIAFHAGIRTLCLETAQSRPLTLEFYRKHGYQEMGRGTYGAVETVRFTKTLDGRT